MNEELCLSDAAAALPRRNGKRIHVKTLIRWIRTGCRGVRLAGWKRGGVWFTSAEALERFREECTQPAPAVTTPISRELKARDEAARKRLEQMGFYGKAGRPK